MTDLPKVVATAPERIWLQVCDPASRDADFPHQSEVAYIRADLPLFGPPIPYKPGDELQADVVLAILGLGSCACGAVIVTRESIKRYDGSVSHYCIPTRSLTR